MSARRPLARALDGWYRAHARDLPWRRDARLAERGPYCVWVSEIMLQQTQVATVVPYYERWMAEYPTIEALADAPLEEVLSRWSGLGYYARCRNLHRAARLVVERHGGRLPEDPDALRALPGIGPYTLGAIRSIAFGEKVPLVDGNVVRVLCRIDAVDGDPRSKPVTDALWARAEQLVGACDDPSVHNQALMELGATLCTPSAPACLLCPVAKHCRAHGDGREAELPRAARRPRRRVEQALCAVAEREGGEILLARRPERGLLGGLWEPPRVGPEAVREARALGTVTHVFTHIELTLHVFGLEVAARAPGPKVPETYTDARFVHRDALAEVPLSTLARKVLALAGVRPIAERA